MLPTDLQWKDRKTGQWHLHDPHTALPLRLRRACREMGQHPHVLVGHRDTGKPPDLGACAATAGAVRRNDSPDLAAQPD